MDAVGIIPTAKGAAMRDDFDPVQCHAACPVCGAYGGAEPGQPTAPHQPQGSREMCPGSGQPAI